METPKQAVMNVILPLDIHAQLKLIAQHNRRSLKQQAAKILVDFVTEQSAKVSK